MRPPMGVQAATEPRLLRLVPDPPRHVRCSASPPVVLAVSSRRVLFEECRFDGERVAADGVLSGAVELFERLVISANGDDVEMIVTAMTWENGNDKCRWHAEDAASFRGRHTVLASALDAADELEFSTPLRRPVTRRISGSSSGIDMSRPNDHGIVRALP